MSLLAASTNYWARLNLVKVFGVHPTVGPSLEYGTHGVALVSCSRNGKFKLKQWAANESSEGSVNGRWLGAAGAGRDCAPAALDWRFWAAPQPYR